MENSLLKYSYKAAHLTKAAVEDLDIPTLIVNHPFMYFGLTFGVTLLVGYKLGYFDDAIFRYKFQDVRFPHDLEALKEDNKLRMDRLHPKIPQGTKIPEPMKLDHIDDNPFEWPIHFEDNEVSGIEEALEKQHEYDILHCNNDMVDLVNWTVDTAVTFGIAYPYGNKILLNIEDFGMAPFLVERHCHFDLVFNGYVRPWKFYSNVVQDAVLEAKRPFNELWYFTEVYLDKFIQKLDGPNETYYLAIHKLNFSKFLDAYYGLGINTLKYPFAKQWLTDPWHDATYFKFLMLRREYVSSFKYFTRMYCEPSILLPENLASFKAHQLAFKKMWVYLSMNVPPEVLMKDITFVDRMVTYSHYITFLN